MQKISTILFSILVSGGQVLLAQTYGEQPTIARPSVNENFNVNDDNDVDLYKGRNEVNLPFYSLEVGGNKMPFGLIYAAGNGFKVKDVSGYYGMGWQLSGGGAVSRHVMGIPDEEPKGYCGTERFGTELNTYNENTLTAATLDKIGKDGYDGEPDLFTANTAFFSFQFVLDQNGNVVFPNPNGFKVVNNFNNNSNYTNTNFEITDNAGNRFIFGKTSSTRETVTTKIGTTDKTFVTTWFLEQIIWFNEKAKVNFTYAAAANYTITNSVYSKTTFVTSPTCSGTDIPETKIDYPHTVNSPKYVTRAESVNARIDFIYEFNREDITTMPKLSGLNVSSLAAGIPTLLHSFSLKYIYAGTTAAANRRLYLSSIEKLDGATWVQLFVLDYYNDNPLPSIISKEFDYWGYYNTNTTGSATVPTANKQPDLNRTMSGVLKSIKHITGEKNIFTYDANTYYNIATASNVTGSGVRLKRISMVDENNVEVNYTDYVYQESNGNSTGEMQSENYKQFTKQINVFIVTGSGICGIVATNTTSNAAFANESVNDEKVGYSKVIKKAKDNSKEEYYFTNFSQFPDIFTNRISNNAAYSFASSRQLNVATSRAFKRGILTKKIIYSASQVISETIYEYSNLGTVAVNTAISVKVSGQTYAVGANITVWLYGVAYTLNDVYRLSKITNIEHSQTNTAEIVETITDYTYAANNRQVRKSTTTDSRGGITENQTYYPADAASLSTNPLFSASNITIMNELQSKNLLDNAVYTKIVKGANVSETGIYYEKVPAVPTDKYFLNKVSRNVNGQNMKDVYVNYERNFSNLISSREKENAPTSYQWGYDQQFPVAKVENATFTSTTSLQPSPVTSSVFLAGSSGFASFTSPTTGDIVLTMYGATGYTYTLNYFLSGPVQRTGNLCAQRSSAPCSFPETITFTNMPAGYYTLSVDVYSGSAPTKGLYYTYQANSIVTTEFKEFFYQGFEEESTGAIATPFAGKKYYQGDYIVFFTTPNSRRYEVNYRYLDGTTWKNMTKPFTTNMVLTEGSAIDEVRVYPIDAQITSYTYDPLVGITSETGPDGISTFYEYDSFGRLKVIRDQEKNIIRTFEYKYQQPVN